MNVEEEHLDVLQNIEFAIVTTYGEQPELVDFDVENALTELLRIYQAEQIERPIAPRPMTDESALVFARVKAMCDWRLGRSEALTAEGGDTAPAPPPISYEVLLACLKRIRKSVRTWTKRGGRRGYLSFVQEYVR